MVGGMEEFGGEAGDVSLHFASGGSAVRVWGCGAGKIPDVYADAGKFQWVPGAVVLRDVQSFSLAAGGAADA